MERSIEQFETYAENLLRGRIKEVKSLNSKNFLPYSDSDIKTMSDYLKTMLLQKSKEYSGDITAKNKIVENILNEFAISFNL